MVKQLLTVVTFYQFEGIKYQITEYGGSNLVISDKRKRRLYFHVMLDYMNDISYHVMPYEFSVAQDQTPLGISGEELA